MSRRQSSRRGQGEFGGANSKTTVDRLRVRGRCIRSATVSAASPLGFIPLSSVLCARTSAIAGVFVNYRYRGLRVTFFPISWPTGASYAVCGFRNEETKSSGTASDEIESTNAVIQTDFQTVPQRFSVGPSSLLGDASQKWYSTGSSDDPDAETVQGGFPIGFDALMGGTTATLFILIEYDVEFSGARDPNT